jgi:hypothetical protein
MDDLENSVVKPKYKTLLRLQVSFTQRPLVLQRVINQIYQKLEKEAG